MASSLVRPFLGSTPALTAADLAATTLAAEVANVLQIDPHLRAGPTADNVHEARVAVRRLRGHLRTFADLFDAAWAAGLSERARWLGHGLSAARDADVLLAGVAARAARLPHVTPERVAEALQPLRAERAAAYGRLAELVAEPRYAALLEELAAAAREPHLSPAADMPAATIVGILMQPVWRRLAKAVRRAGRAPDDAALHRIRIRAKYLRYAAEAMVPVAGRRAGRFARRVETLQTQLGKQHDAVNAAAVLSEHQRGPHPSSLDAELAVQEIAAAAQYRQRWRAHWKRIEDKGARFW